MIKYKIVGIIKSGRGEKNSAIQTLRHIFEYAILALSTRNMQLFFTLYSYLLDRHHDIMMVINFKIYK